MEEKTILRRGEQLNNPGNIGKNGRIWPGEVRSPDPRFKAFITPEAGTLELGKLLIQFQKDHKCDTVSKIITRYAPAFENNVEAYIDDVCQRTSYAPDEHLDLCDYGQLWPLIHAIIIHEQGRCIYSGLMIQYQAKRATEMECNRGLD